MASTFPLITRMFFFSSGTHNHRGLPLERRAAFRLGVNAYLLKEVDTPKLVESIRNLTKDQEN